jgi:peptide/nickel transport system substrate-binding protein
MALAIVIVVGVASTGCASGGDSGGDGAAAAAAGGAAPPGGEPQRGGKLVYGLSQELSGFNPASSRLTSSGLNIAKAIYDPIAVLNTEGIAVPYLVEAIDHNADFTEWTLTPRTGVTFHNGDPLTPEILAQHFEIMKAAPLTSFMMGTIERVSVGGADADGESPLATDQVRIVMSEPWSAFPALLAGFQVGFVAHPDFVDGTVEEPIGTGPFEFDEWIAGDHLTVTRNATYWRAGLPYLDEVEFRLLIDPMTRLSSVESGDLDLMGTNAVSQVVDLRTDPRFAESMRFIEDSGGGDEILILLNTQSGPAADLEVRRALALATDRRALIDGLYGGYYEPADSPFRDDSPWATDPGWPEPDKAAATRLVEEWEADNGPLTITLTSTTSQDDVQLVQAIAAQWSEAGIDTTVDAIDATTATQRLPLGQFEAYLLQFFNGADPDELFTFMDPRPEKIGGPGEFSLNFSRYTSDAVREGLQDGRRLGDPAARAAAYDRVWKDFAENLPYIWLFHTDWVIVASSDVGGIDAFTTPDGAPAAPHVWGSVFLTETWMAT